MRSLELRHQQKMLVKPRPYLVEHSIAVGKRELLFICLQCTSKTIIILTNV